MTCEVRFRTRSGPGSGEGTPVGRVEVAPGTTLLEAVRRAGLPIARACAAGGLCGRCGLSILAGAQALAPEGAVEARAKASNRIDPALRLACQVRVQGPLEVSASYW
jgi:ferredoxin